MLSRFAFSLLAVFSCWPKKKRSIELDDLARLAWTFETGLRSGRDWTSIVKWIAQRDSKAEVREYFRLLGERLKVDSAEGVLKQAMQNSQETIWRLFFEILLQAQRGSTQLSQLFSFYGQICFAIVKMKEKEKSLLFIPRFQTWVAVLITLAFTVVMPWMAPQFFPTFLTLGRWDLFVFGIAVIAIGFWILRQMTLKPKRLLEPMLSTTFFLYFLSIYVESGVDLSTAWRRATDTVNLTPVLKAKFYRQGLSTDTFDDYLSNLIAELNAPWPDILGGLLWSKNSGVGISQYLKSTSERESEKIFFLWEDLVRKATLFALLPLGLFIMPGTLFMVVGPQFLELIQL